MHLSYIDYPMLEHLSVEELQQLAPEMQEEHYEPGKLIMQKGEVSQRVYILVSGQVQVFISTEIKVELAILSKGQFFGEMSCLTGDPISAHVEAIDNVHVISVSRSGMLLLMDKNREFREPDHPIHDQENPKFQRTCTGRALEKSDHHEAS